MANTTQFNNDILKTLSPEERELALSILNDLSTGDSQSYEDLKYAEYKEAPVDFLTFIDDDRYLGKAWKDANGKSKMYPYWRKKLCELFPNNLTTAVNNAIFSGARGLGKMNPLDTPVLTSEGFIPMGEVKVGTLVYGRDGKLHKVLQIFPHGYQDIYKVAMSDGTSSECGLEHLWQVTDHHTFREHKYCTPEIRVVDTKYLLGIDFNHSKNRFSIPMCEPIEFNHKDTFIEPYVMGLLLGDGYLGDKGVNLTSADNAILEAFSKYVEKSSGGSYHVVKISRESKSKSQCYRISKVDITHRSRNIYLEEAGRLDLLNKKSHTKFIPKDYLYNDINSRVDLLQGLMDIDGTIVKSKRRDGKGYCYNLNYFTVSEQLKEDFIWLVQSLGGTAGAVKRKSHYKNSRGQIIECKDHYRISLKLPPNIKPFRLERKLSLYNQYTHQNPSRYIVKVEKIPEQKEAQCIYIEGNEHLYLVNDFIVTHNTENAIAAALYLMHRVMCLKDPLAHFHLKTTDTVVFAFMNITQKLSEEIGITKLQNTVKLSPWFMERGRMVGRTNPLWEPPEPIRVVVGSQAKDVIGQAVIFGFFDEISFIRQQDLDKQKAIAKDMINTCIGGMKTRYIFNGENSSLLILASSKRSDKSFLEEHMRKKLEDEQEEALIVDEPVWNVKPPETYSGKKFKVALGNKFLTSQVVRDDIDIEELKERGYKILDVPIELKSEFVMDIDRALCDFAGISSSEISKYISGEAWRKCIDESYVNPFSKEILEIGLNDDIQYKDFFDLTKVKAEYKNFPLFIHMDMSLAGDKTGIAGTWITRKRVASSETSGSSDLYLRVAFAVDIKAPKGTQISLEKNRRFIYWLKEMGFNIKGITTDTFQSADTGQTLLQRNYPYKVLSVDRVDTDHICRPYQYFRNCIYEQRVACFYCEKLSDEITDLERNINTGKVDHTDSGSKDMCDAVCGSLYNASTYADQFAYDYGEVIDTIKETNMDMDQAQRKQVTVDLENELKDILQPTAIKKQSQENKKDTYSNDLFYLNQGIFIL